MSASLVVLRRQLYPTVPSASLIPVALAGSVALSVAIGFIGAPGGERFDWRLCAEIGTALGTLLLAAYTAWLASTTRREVGLAIEEQRARDRPVVVTLPLAVTNASIDPTIGATMPALVTRLRNVGLGPALDIYLEASEGERVLGQELAPLLGVDESLDVSIALTFERQRAIGDYRIEDLTIRGHYTDRTRQSAHETVPVRQEGLVDLQRAAARIASVRASLWLTVGPPRLEGDELVYPLSIGNNGEGTASDVAIWAFVDASEFNDLAAKPIELESVPGREGASATLRLAASHPQVRISISWSDGTTSERKQYETVIGEQG